MTTSFDLLLERAAKNLRVPAQTYALGSIPRPARRREFAGVLHIHGALTRNPSHHSDLILTDQDFGEYQLRRRVVPDLVYDAARLVSSRSGRLPRQRPADALPLECSCRGRGPLRRPQGAVHFRRFRRTRCRCAAGLARQGNYAHSRTTLRTGIIRCFVACSSDGPIFRRSMANCRLVHREIRRIVKSRRADAPERRSGTVRSSVQASQP